MTDEHVIFTKVDRPGDFRRAELESLKEVIHVLQSFERLKKIRTDKAEKSILLAKQMKELGALISKAKGLYPNMPGPGKKAAKKKKPKKAKKGKKEKQQKLVEPKGLDALEKQLKDIQGKLDVIS